MDFQIKEALSVALNNNILKEDSLLARNIAETWTAHQNFEDDLQVFKKEISKFSNSSTILQLGGKIESSSNDLKQCITNAIK